MDTQPTFSAQDLFTHVITEMAQAVCMRRDEPRSKQLERAQRAAWAIAVFQPCDAYEIMIAGQSVMYHEVIVDSVRTTLRGEPDSTRCATRNNIVAMDKAFGVNLLRLERYRASQANSRGIAQPAVPRAEAEIADRVRRHQSGAPSAQAQPDAEPADASSLPEGVVAPEPVSPAEAAQPESPLGDSDTGDDRPCDAHPATAAGMPGLNRQARRAIARQAGKRVDPGALAVATANRLVRP
jgi:hypothetical protein